MFVSPTRRRDVLQPISVQTTSTPRTSYVEARCILTEEEMLEQGLALIGFSVNQRRRTALAVVTCRRASLALSLPTLGSGGVRNSATVPRR
jgi:hypothetical protein